MSNLRNEDTKMIKILSEKHIYSKGGIFGPVLTPFRETVADIFLMLLENVELVEVTEDGKDVKLTIQNFNKVNTGVTEEEVEDEEDAEEGAGDEEESVDGGEESEPKPEPVPESKEVKEEKPQHQNHKNQKKFKEDKLNRK